MTVPVNTSSPITSSIWSERLFGLAFQGKPHV